MDRLAQLAEEVILKDCPVRYDLAALYDDAAARSRLMLLFSSLIQRTAANAYHADHRRRHFLHVWTRLSTLHSHGTFASGALSLRRLAREQMAPHDCFYFKEPTCESRHRRLVRDDLSALPSHSTGLGRYMVTFPWYGTSGEDDLHRVADSPVTSFYSDPLPPSPMGGGYGNGGMRQYRANLNKHYETYRNLCSAWDDPTTSLQPERLGDPPGGTPLIHLADLAVQKGLLSTTADPEARRPIRPYADSPQLWTQPLVVASIFTEFISLIDDNSDHADHADKLISRVNDMYRAANAAVLAGRVDPSYLDVRRIAALELVPYEYFLHHGVEYPGFSRTVIVFNSIAHASPMDARQVAMYESLSQREGYCRSSRQAAFYPPLTCQFLEPSRPTRRYNERVIANPPGSDPLPRTASPSTGSTDDTTNGVVFQHHLVVSLSDETRLPDWQLVPPGHTFTTLKRLLTHSPDTDLSSTDGQCSSSHWTGAEDLNLRLDSGGDDGQHGLPQEATLRFAPADAEWLNVPSTQTIYLVYSLATLDLIARLVKQLTGAEVRSLGVYRCVTQAPDFHDCDRSLKQIMQSQYANLTLCSAVIDVILDLSRPSIATAPKRSRSSTLRSFHACSGPIPSPPPSPPPARSPPPSQPASPSRVQSPVQSTPPSASPLKASPSIQRRSNYKPLFVAPTASFALSPEIVVPTPLRSTDLSSVPVGIPGLEAEEELLSDDLPATPAPSSPIVDPVAGTDVAYEAPQSPPPSSPPLSPPSSPPHLPLPASSLPGLPVRTLRLKGGGPASQTYMDADPPLLSEAPSVPPAPPHDRFRNPSPAEALQLKPRREGDLAVAAPPTHFHRRLTLTQLRSETGSNAASDRMVANHNLTAADGALWPSTRFSTGHPASLRVNELCERAAVLVIQRKQRSRENDKSFNGTLQGRLSCPVMFYDDEPQRCSVADQVFSTGDLRPELRSCVEAAPELLPLYGSPSRPRPSTPPHPDAPCTTLRSANGTIQSHSTPLFSAPRLLTYCETCDYYSYVGNGWGHSPRWCARDAFYQGVTPETPATWSADDFDESQTSSANSRTAELLIEAEERRRRRALPCDYLSGASEPPDPVPWCSCEEGAGCPRPDLRGTRAIAGARAAQLMHARNVPPPALVCSRCRTPACAKSDGFTKRLVRAYRCRTCLSLIHI